MLDQKEDPSSSCCTPSPQPFLTSCILNSWLPAKDSTMKQLLFILSPGLMNPSLPVPSAYFLESRPSLPCV